MAAYVVLAFWVTSGVWRHIGALSLVNNLSDVPFFEWDLVHATRIFTDAENPFFSPQLNAPNGVNMMANTGLLGLAVPLSERMDAGAPEARRLMEPAAAWYVSNVLLGSPPPENGVARVYSGPCRFKNGR